MARLPEIKSRADLPEDKQHIIDDITEEQGRLGMPFTLLLHSPEVAARASHLRKYLFFDTVLPPFDKNLGLLVAARECDWQYGWGIITNWCRESGCREEAIDVVANRRSLDSLAEEEAVIVAYGREMLVDHRVSDATFEAARARYGDQGLTELTTILGFYTMVGCTLNAFGVEARPDRERLP
ncbi:MAG: hypothetical protein Q7O66_15045 [Dehalococcoidia bacterium]|nr:hypothetical protein [Dehalococcoidia bacterium]